MTPGTGTLGARTDALVTARYTLRAREPDRVAIETPERRDFWYGHGFVLDEPPHAKRLDALIDEGRGRFGRLGAQRFIVTWERAYDAPEPLWDYVCAPGVEWNRAIVMRYAGSAPEPAAGVADLCGDLDWTAAGDVIAEEYRRDAALDRWRLGHAREDVAAGRARMVAVAEGGRPAAVCGLYRDAVLARFYSPVTARAARGRGYFRACARTLIAWALEGAPREVVIAVNEDGPVELYRSLGFTPVTWQHAVVANATPTRRPLSERLPC